MAINFPNNPNNGDTHSSGGKTWVWDGTSWKLNSNTTSGGIALTDLSVTTTAVGTAALSYNDGTGVFSYTPPNLSGYSATTHNHSFISITGTPSSYDAGKWLQSTANGVEWVTAPSGANTTYSLEALLSTGIKLTGSDTTTDSVFFDTAGGISITRSVAPGPDGGGTIKFDTSNVTPTNITVADESADDECYPLFAKDATGNIAPKTGTNIKFNALSGQLEAGSFKKTGGSSSEFLKADGSVDSNTYLSSVALNDLSNVDATTNLANGKILKYDLGSTTWVVADDNASGGGSSSFTGLSDTPSAHSNDKWLKSNGSALIWSNAPALNSLTDVTISGSPADDSILQYDTTDSRWKPATLPSGDTTYTLSAVQGGTSVNIRLTGSDTTEDNVLLTPGTGLSLSSITADGFTINSTDTLDSVTGRGATTNNDLTVGSFTCNNLTVNGTTTTVNSNTVNIGDSNLTLNSDETGTPSQNGGLTIERGTSANVELRWNETSDKWQFTNDGSTYSDIGSSSANTFLLLSDTPSSYTAGKWLKAGSGSLDWTDPITYDMTTDSVTGGGIIRLTNELDNTTDDVQILGGTSITVQRSADHKLTINSDITNLNSLTDVTISGSPADNSVLQYNSSNLKWEVVAGTSVGTDNNNYANSLSFNTSNGVLTVGRSGLGDLTVDLDNRYAIGTIPTNNNQLTNGAGYLTSSGTITNSEKIRIRTDSGNVYHNLLFCDSGTDNQFQIAKMDNETGRLAWNPNQNTLIAQAVASYRMLDWSSSYGSAGQVLTSQGSGQWNWTTPSSGFLGKTKITIRTSGSGNHTTESWCKTVWAIVQGGGGAGGSARSGTAQGGHGGHGGQQINYQNDLTSATSIPYSVGGGGARHGGSGNCDDAIQSGGNGGSSYFGPTNNRGTAAGGTGGAGAYDGQVGANGTNGGVRFFVSDYGAGGQGGTHTGGDGCNNTSTAGTGGAIWILELG